MGKPQEEKDIKELKVITEDVSIVEKAHESECLS